MKLCFDSIEETKEFVKQLKGTRGGKAGGDDEGAGTSGSTTAATAPLQPPQGGFNPGGGGPAFNPGGGGPAFNPGGVGFAGPVVAPEIQALVTRITTRVDNLVSSGQQPAEAILNWFRGQCGPEAAQYTLDQIKQVSLPKASMPTLENIAKLIGA